MTHAKTSLPSLFLILSCEHATNAIPRSYQSLFRGNEEVLESHRGWDPGTLQLGKALKCRFKVDLHQTTVSRLLVEVNRSVTHPRLFSEFSACLSPDERNNLLVAYYFPYREAVEHAIREAVQRKKTVLHLSLHSFTPQLGTDVRKADIGLLYDPARPLEREFSARWAHLIRQVDPRLKVRKNYPYLGKADGFTTYLRKQFSAADYLGIELEVNQSYMQKSSPAFKRITKTIVASLHKLRGELEQATQHWKI